jgi:hypothetical protein
MASPVTHTNITIRNDIGVCRGLCGARTDGPGIRPGAFGLDLPRREAWNRMDCDRARTLALETTRQTGHLDTAQEILDSRTACQ